MSLFHSPEFVRLHGLSIVLATGSDLSLLIGPERGTYGGFSRAAPLAEMESLVSSLPRECTIKLAPASHDIELFSRSMNVLHRAGFMLDSADLNYDLRPLNITFSDSLSDGARKKLAKCAAARFHSRTLERTEWYRAYTLLYRNRAAKGIALSVPLADIEAVEEALPGTYMFFATFSKREMLAAAICVRVQTDILYIYAWGDAGRNEFSPTTHLCESIYEEACFMPCRLLDAGVSTVNGKPDSGLIAYKESLGFRPSVKATMVRHG